MWQPLFQNFTQFLIILFTQSSSFFNIIENLFVRVDHVFQKLLFKVINVLNFHLIQVTIHSSINNTNLVFGSHWNILFLLQKFCQLFPSVQQTLSGSIQVTTKLTESSYFSILCQIQFEFTSNRFHCFQLSFTSHSTNR